MDISNVNSVTQASQIEKKDEPVNDEQNDNSIWAEYNDTGKQGKVDMNDVIFNKVSNSPWYEAYKKTVTDFLSQHIDNDWTEDLKNEFNNILTKFSAMCNMESNTDELSANLDNAQQYYDNFKEDAENKMYEFNGECNDAIKGMQINSLTTILNDLKKEGYNGHINIKNGQLSCYIVYNKETKSFDVTIKNGNSEPKTAGVKEDKIQQTFNALLSSGKASIDAKAEIRKTTFE